MPRQKRILYLFTFLAVLGLGMYLLLPPESELRLFGIVMMIFGFPMVLRHMTRYAKERAATLLPAATPPAFTAREVHVTLEATFLATVATDRMRSDKDILELWCLLALGTEGFSVRLWRLDKITGPWPGEETIILNAQFLVPQRALPRFPADTNAQVLLGNAFIGSVKVLSANVAALAAGS